MGGVRRLSLALGGSVEMRALRLVSMSCPLPLYLYEVADLHPFLRKEHASRQ